MGDYQNPESSTPENKEPTRDNNTAQNNAAPLNNAYALNNNQPQRPYQQQNTYQPQQQYANNHAQYDFQPPNNGTRQYAYPPNYPPQYYGYNNPARGKATASLVLGIISLVFCWMSFLAVISIVCSIIGIIMGNSARKVLTPEQGHGQATAGLICSIIGLALSVLMIILFTFIIITAVSYSTPFGATYGM